MITGQVVDTITNIKTVKLFASAEYEDRAALGAMADVSRPRAGFRAGSNTWFRLSLTVVAGLLPVVLVGGAILLWSAGQRHPGRHRRVGRHRDAAGADDRLGQHGADGHLGVTSARSRTG